MNKMTNAVVNERKEQLNEKQNLLTHKVKNFMGGDSFELNSLETLKMISASSIFGEPAYYRNGEFSKSYVEKDKEMRKIIDGIWNVCPLEDLNVFNFEEFENKTTTQVMESTIDASLEENYGATLEWAKTLRKDFLMRLNPQVIMVRAAMHKNREEWTRQNPGEFLKINNIVMQRADDVIVQLTYWLYLNGSKKNIPSILKRSWANRIEKLSRYEISKYRNKGVGLIDTIRISHANCSKNNDLLEFIKLPSNVALEMDANALTWERLRSDGKTWKEILNTINMPYMALLRNLKNIFKEIDDVSLAKEIGQKLIDGVSKGKQFPFRYMNAIKVISNEKLYNKVILKDALETCLDKSCENLPKLAGKNAFLSDNSGSAWSTFNSEYGSVTVAEIGNLSCYIGATNSEDGHVFGFGDTLIEGEASKRQGILTQAMQFSKNMHKSVGGGTENGIWLFLKDAIDNKIHWDNIFIFSDMQAGHGGLYGKGKDMKEYMKRGYSCMSYSKNRNKTWTNGYSNENINVPKLINEYRKTVNPKVNVFCVQTAGYDNMLIPENSYRTGYLYGWTGKELVYAAAINDFWDEKDLQNKNCSSN